MTMELALSELRRDTDVQLANLEGQLALLLQRNELNELQVRDQARQLGELEDRLSAAERDQVTRGQLDNRFRHTLALLSLIAAIASVAVALLTTMVSR
ncbi:hypothetical protein AGRA3207_001398 [Actinomadura graeca]|uniref:DUF1640 domain-containing protein n=1 Tax=Actinomadura graeca TaxID=2750812 RepID=A0ABX8QV34_9ACTN|nr:hypothetical protein [Actinomadura graeca]QXJ20648.1 hypothetical protein AGRA3207_001398 [Actinomadura graeca]